MCLHAENNCIAGSKFSLEFPNVSQIRFNNSHEILCIFETLQHFSVRLEFLNTECVAYLVNQILQVDWSANYCEHEFKNFSR